MIAMALFLVMAGAAFTLFNQHVELASRQQNLSAVNIGLRNAMAQLEIDLASAGQNLLSSVPQSPNATTSFSLGVIIHNNVSGNAAACTVNKTTWAYPVSSVCFDSLEVINPKPCSGCGATYPSAPYVPVLTITDSSDDLSTTSTMLAADANPADPLSLATVAANFQTGDELLILNPTSTAVPPNTPHCSGNAVSTSQSGYCMTVVTLTANASISGSNLQLTHTLTGTNGKPLNCPGTSCTDPLGLIYDLSAPSSLNYYPALTPGKFGTSAQTGYVIDLGSGAGDIWYSVQQDPSNSSDTQLMRCVGGPCNGTNEQELTDQVIGFKAGAALWNQASTTDIGTYFYNAANYCNGAFANCTTSPAPTNDPYDFSLVRSVRISMIARTTFTQFKNGFDGGPYLVQQASTVVDLRNASMTEFGN